ncbi:MAG: argininosuccinate lyase [Bryobacterales bacterium]|nr:argininosuccinate lyase [Bryobacterales bacterium]
MAEEKVSLWGGRFAEGPSETFRRYSWSLHFDKRLLAADIRGSQAFARALEGVGILTATEREQLVTAFENILKDSREPGFLEGADDEDIHTLVIRKLKEEVGGLADKIHTGRSRNEQVSLDTRLWLRGEIESVQARIGALLEALVELAKRYPNAVIPGYTHMRRAQAVLWPHYLLAYFEMFSRDWERMEQARARTNVMPLGSGALAGSGFPFNREAIAADLGFGSITRNSMDVSADRDFVLDFLYAASVTMIHLSRLAEDWILYSSEEFGWLELSDTVTSGSSLMPQKKNPDSMELLRGKCGRVVGALNSLIVTMKALPLTYNRDMQEDKEMLFDAMDTLQLSLDMTRVVVESAQLKTAPPLAAAEESWVVATDLAEALARSGMPFHNAHKLVGRLVLYSVNNGKKPGDWTAEQLAAFDPAFTAEFARLLHPAEGMKSRNIAGGTGPDAVAAALQQAEQRLAALRK